MRSNRITYLILFVFCFLPALAGHSFGQKPAATPRQEKLLNGLKVLVRNTPGAEKTTLRLRIHSGAAFDPQDKEGVMTLLSDSFFPNADSKEFFTNELGGTLEVECSYDFIQITARAKGSEFLTLLDTVAQAVTAPDLSKEATATLKAALERRVATWEKDPSYIADLAVSKRLFGTFPYGRPVSGSTASIQRIDFADLRFAKDRLLTADNATLAIEGSVDPALAFRAARRYFGSWLKADKPIPSTFRQPDPPDRVPVKLEVPGLTSSEVRFAVKGLSRSSPDLAAAEVLSNILGTRFGDAVSEAGGRDANVVHEEHVLPGVFIFRYRSAAPEMFIRPAQGDGSQNALFGKIYPSPVTEAEFSTAKAAVLADIGRRDPLELWLDADTFRLVSPEAELKNFQAVSLANVRALASKLAVEPLASAIVSGPEAATTTN